MISLIFKSYFAILLSIGIGSIFCFILGLFLIFKSAKRKQVKNNVPDLATTKTVVTSNDISAIAGDDVIATQLDLARAYIETGKMALAKKILEYVSDNGTESQQEEASRLLSCV
jgi:FimV-like protein